MTRRHHRGGGGRHGRGRCVPREGRDRHPRGCAGGRGRWGQDVRGGCEQFGRHDDDALRVFDENTGRATEILTTLRDEVRDTEPDDPDDWPVYGSLLCDGLRMTTELRSAREAAVVPTDTGPLRLPPTESEVWVKVQRSAKHVPWRRPTR